MFLKQKASEGTPQRLSSRMKGRTNKLIIPHFLLLHLGFYIFHIWGFCCFKFESTMIGLATPDTSSILFGPWIGKCPGPEVLSFDSDMGDPLEVVRFVPGPCSTILDCPLVSFSLCRALDVLGQEFGHDGVTLRDSLHKMSLKG